MSYCLAYTDEILSNLSGGIRRGTAYQGLLDFGLDLDLEKLARWPGQFHANGYWTHGPSPTAKYVGDLQGVSNLDAWDTVRLDEIWYQHDFWEDRISLKIGQHAADKEFIISEYSALFLNGAFGWPSFIGANAATPAFPLSTLGARLRIEPVKSLYFQAAVFDGDTGSQTINDRGTHWNLNRRDGLFSLGEMGYTVTPKIAGMELPGTCRFGVWNHTDSFADQAYDQEGLSLADPATSGGPRLHKGNFGVYGIFDQLVYREASQSADEVQGAGIFMKAGTAPSDRNLVSLQLSGGIHDSGLFPGRDQDLCGIAVTHVEAGDHIRILDQDTNLFNGTDVPQRGHETTIEATYKFAINPRWSVQPDFQWVLHPSAAPTVGDAVVIGIRSQITF